MDEDKHVQHLIAFRAMVVEERRRLAERLSAEKGKTAAARQAFVDMQQTIDAIDRALTDERHSAGKSKPPVMVAPPEMPGQPEPQY